MAAHACAEVWKRFAASCSLPAAPEEVDVFCRNASGATPLIFAAIAGDAAGCRALLDVGAELTVNVPDNSGRTALFYAANGGHDEITRLLLDRGGACESFLLRAESHAALFRAVERLDFDEARRILEARDPEGSEGDAARRASDRSYARAFVAAARAGSLPLVRLLLERWPQSAQAVDRTGRRRPPELQRYLADWIDIRDATGGPTVADDALFNAGLGGSLDVIRFLVEREREREGASVSHGSAAAPYGGYELALCAAVAAGRTGLAQTLVEECGADVRKHFRRLGRPLNCAARYGRLQAARYLLERGASAAEGAANWLNALGDQAAWPPLLDAAGGGHADLCRLLLEHGASPAAAGRPARVGFSGPTDIVTPLEFAAERGQPECLEALLAAGVDVAAPATASHALHLASYRGSAGAVRFLTERGVPATARRKPAPGPEMLDALDPENTEAIFSAARGWRPDCVRALVAAGCGARLPPRDRSPHATPLHVACEAHCVPRSLLEVEGAEADPAGAAAAAAVAAAVQRQWAETVRALVESGAGQDALPPAALRAALRREGGPPRTEDYRNCFPLGIAFLGPPPLPAPQDLVRTLLTAAEAALEGQLEKVLSPEVPSGADALVCVAGMLLAQAAPRQPADTVKLLLDYAEGLKPGCAQDLLASLRAEDLLRAFRNGPAVELLLEAGLSVAAIAPLLHEAIGDPVVTDAIVGRLLDTGAAPTSPAIHYACGATHHVAHASDDENKALRLRGWRPRSEALIRRLVTLGLDPNEAAPVFGSPLHVAVHHGPAPVRLLLELGARPDAVREATGARGWDEGDVRKWPGGTPLHDAFRLPGPGPSLELVQLLLMAGAPLDALDSNGQQPLAIAKPAAARSLLLRATAERLSAPEAERPKAWKGFLLAAAACAKDGDAEETRTALDVLLTSDGPIDAREWAFLQAAAAGGGEAVARLVAGATLVAEGEGRISARGHELNREQARTVDVDRGASASLAEACRHGFRLCALRLAAAIPIDFVDLPDARGETPLWHAVAGGPPMLDVCLALLQRGADATRTAGEGPACRMALQGHSDWAFVGALKRAAGVRDVHLCRAGGTDEAAFAARLRDGLEAAHVTCSLPEAGEDGEADPEAGPRRSQAVVLVVSPAMAASARCRAELAAARRLGRPVYPVWRAKCDLDDALQGALMKQQFADLSTDALFESGLRPFALTLAQRLAAGGAGAGGAGAEAAAAAELAAAPEARCDPGGTEPFLFVWCHAADADFALEFVRGAARRGARCWAECSGWEGRPPASELATDEGARAAVRCAAFVPILTSASLADPLLRDRLQLAEMNKRRIRPLVPSGDPAPEGVFTYPSFPFFTHGKVALLAVPPPPRCLCGPPSGARAPPFRAWRP